MALEEIKAAIAVLMDEIAAQPKDSRVLQEQLREKIAEMRALGLPIPADLLQFEADLSNAKGDDDLFDNLPV